MNVHVVIPAHNEAPELRKLLDRLASEFPDYRVTVVNDGSTDGTVDLVRDRDVSHVWLGERMGVGAATKWGLGAVAAFVNKWDDPGPVRHREWDVIVTMDADGQHDPADIPGLVDTLVSGNFDLVVGRRDRFEWRRGRGFARWFFDRLTGVPGFDSQCGFRAMTPQAAHAFAEHAKFWAKDYAVCSEMLIFASRRGWRIGSHPVKTLHTAHSLTKPHRQTVWSAPRLARSILKARWTLWNFERWRRIRRA